MSNNGTVILVGGGPGSDDLLTLAGARALASADVVLYDRLSPHENLGTLAPRATLVNVGKTPGHHPIGQTDIERMLVDHARDGKTVVRLKGGDPYVFGRGSEEVIACQLAGVPVTVIAGVTSAVAVPQAAGIPLTHRGVAHMFTVVSGHAPLSEDEHLHLAKLGGTVVVLMGVATLPTLTQGLLKFGRPTDTPVAIIESGFSEDQRVTLSQLDTVVHDAARARVTSPAILVIGEVVRLAYSGDADAAALLLRAQRMADLG